MAMVTKEKITASEAREAICEINELMLELSDAVLTIYGKSYPLKDWITVSDYAKRYEMSVGRVQNWIAREVVPAECWIVVPELNNLRLIRNQAYEPRGYGSRG